MKVQTARSIRIVVELIGIAIFAWMLLVGINFAHAEQQTDPHDGIHRDVSKLQFQMDQLVGPNGESGVMAQTQEHLRNTDKDVADLDAFMNKIMGGLFALGGLQTLNLVAGLLSRGWKATAENPLQPAGK